MKSFTRSNKFNSLHYDNANGETTTKKSAKSTISFSIDRHKSINDRDRRRQIIANLAEKRKQYQKGIGKAERALFQQKIKTSIIKHQKLQNNNNNNTINNKTIRIKARNNENEIDQKEEEETDEQKSISISSSLSISPIQNASKSTSNSPCIISPKNFKHFVQHNGNQETENNNEDSLYNDVRDEELQMLKAQNQRLSNKLQHINTELIETNVFLRSERKRNKNLFNQLKLKENEIADLSQNIDELEIEIEEKDKKCVEIVEKLSEYEQKSKQLFQTQNVNKNLSSQVKQSYNEIKEWQNKYYDIFEKYSSVKSKHKQQIKHLNNELNIRKKSETESINKLKQLMDSQNIEIMDKKKQNEILMNNIHCITKLMQNQIKSNNNNNVSKELNAMLYSNQCNESKSEMDILLQSLIGVVDKCHRLNIHNNEMNLCLTKYENDIHASKNIILDYEQKFMAQQQRLQKLQNNFTVLKNEKLQSDQKSNETTKELQKLYETIFDATNELQRIAVQITSKQDIGDINMNQCIEIIGESVNNNQMKTKILNNSLVEVMTQYLKQMESVEQIFRSVTVNWSERIHGLQDKLSTLQIQLLRNNGTNNSTLSNMSLISDANKSFGMDEIQAQFSQQMVLINDLKNEINDKQHTIDSLILKSNNIKQHSKRNKTVKKLQCEINAMRKERDDALHDFNKIAQEWHNMEQHVECTYNKNESLQKQVNDLEYWINYIAQYMEQRINGQNDIHTESTTYQLQFEAISNDIPCILNKLHSSLMYVLTRMDLNALNETTIAEINDDALLDELFGSVDHNTNNNNNKETEKIEQCEDMIHKLEAEICLQGIINKVELSHVGNKAENIIVAYQNKLKTYHQFIKQLQNKVSQSSQLMHSMSLERDHAWTQYKVLQTEVNKLNKENAILESSMTKNTEKLNNKRDKFNKLMQKYEIKMGSMKQQLKLSEETNNNMHKRLDESTFIIQQITQQRNELEMKCIFLTDKFIQYKKNHDTLFRHSYNTMAETLNPLMIKCNEMQLNQCCVLNERMQNMNEKVKYLQNYIKNMVICKEKEKISEIEKIREQSEKSAIKKLRMHADIHRFQFAKLLQEMKQKYVINIEPLKQKISSLQNKFMKIQNSYCDLQNEYKKQNKNKMIIESQFIQLKKTFNEEIVNYQNVQNKNMEKEDGLNEIINNFKKEIKENKQIMYDLRNELEQNKKYATNIVNENEINSQKREEIQTKLAEQTKKCRKLHSKAVKFQTELKEVRRKNQENENYNKDYTLQICQLNALNESLKESINTKEINYNKMNELNRNKINELKEILENVEMVNNNLNNKLEAQQNEILQYKQQMYEMETLNTQCVERIEIIKNERICDQKRYFEKEEDLRNEINIIRQQMHETTNDLGVMKLNSLEKETEIKKLQNEMNGLDEQILFYKQCELKDKNEREILNKQISKHNKCKQQKSNDIQMILDAKSVRITQLKQDMDNKCEKIKNLETEIIQLNNEILSNKSFMNKQNEKTENNNKLQTIINELSNELNAIKTEKGQLFKDLETQKSVNVQLSIELDSMQQYRNNNNFNDLDKSFMIHQNNNNNNNYSTVSFFDVDLERNNPNTSSSMPNMDSHNNFKLCQNGLNCENPNQSHWEYYVHSTDSSDICSKLNLGKINNYSDSMIKSNSAANYSDIHSANNKKKKKSKRKRAPGLPIPKLVSSQSHSTKLSDHNAEHC